MHILRERGSIKGGKGDESRERCGNGWVRCRMFVK